ncbi:MAG: hypothetical protein AB7G06_05630 [Bdellovibrionales bacterium]
MPKQKLKLQKRREITRAKQPAGTRGPQRKLAKRPLPLLVAPDYGPPERWQHATRRFELTDEDGEQLAARVVEECLLDALYARGVVNSDERAAGLKLRHAYIRAKVEAPRTGKYDPRPREKSQNFRGFVRSRGEERAYQDWRTVLLAVPLHSIDAVVTACCLDEMPPPARLPLLRSGLEALVRYYKG